MTDAAIGGRREVAGAKVVVVNDQFFEHDARIDHPNFQRVYTSLINRVRGTHLPRVIPHPCGPVYCGGT